MKIKVGINGMGRIGRMIVRSIIENNYSNIEIKHINNRTDTASTIDKNIKVTIPACILSSAHEYTIFRMIALSCRGW